MGHYPYRNMVEVQKHGFRFEDWIRQEIFHCMNNENYGRRWDVDKEDAKTSLLPKEMHGLPVSIKTCKWGAPIGLGDVTRQMTIDTDFVMLAGFWKQIDKDHKNFVAIRAVVFTRSDWKNLCRAYKLDDIKVLDESIKDMSIPPKRARDIAAKWKKERKTKDKGCIIINPKIDSKKQRRVQCSLPFEAFWMHLKEDPSQALPQKFCSKIFPNPIKSAPRTLKKSKD
jgi:hypothetical protein